MEWVYFIHDGDDLLYVGKTRGLLDRIVAHESFRYGNDEVFSVATREEIIETYQLNVDIGLEEIEGLMIALHNPSNNRRGPDLVAVHAWPPAAREEAPRRERAKDLIRQLRAYKR